MPNQVQVKPRTRCGSYANWAKRYKPIPDKNGNIERTHYDPEIHAAFDRGMDDGIRYVWTVISGDDNDYVVPGFVTVNYMSRVLCTNPWSDIEEGNPGYLW